MSHTLILDGSFYLYILPDGILTVEDVQHISAAHNYGHKESVAYIAQKCLTVWDQYLNDLTTPLTGLVITLMVRVPTSIARTPLTYWQE